VKAESDAEFRPLSAFPEFARDLPAEAGQAAAPPFVTNPAQIGQRDYRLPVGACISRGWELVARDFWPTVGVTALVTLIFTLVNQMFGLFTRPPMQALIRDHQFSVRGGFILSSAAVLGGPIYTILFAGLYKYFLKKIRGGPAGLADAFAGFGPCAGQLALLGLTQTILVMLGFCCCFLPGIYLAVAWAFSVPLVIDKQMPFWDAMELGRKMVSKHWFVVFGFMIVYALVVMAGVVACCIGIFVTIPIGIAGLMYAYETIFSETPGQ
jgi:hypothetical protein